MWVKDPARVKRDIERHGEEFRLRFVKYALFAGCLTGRRLKAAFGELVDVIHWEETTRAIAGDPRTVFPADLQHMQAVIERQRPAVILTFGGIARDAVVKCRLSISRELSWQLLALPHPAARGAMTMHKLKLGAQEVRWAIAEAARLAPAPLAGAVVRDQVRESAEPDQPADRQPVESKSFVEHAGSVRRASQKGKR